MKLSDLFHSTPFKRLTAKIQWEFLNFPTIESSTKYATEVFHAIAIYLIQYMKDSKIHHYFMQLKEILTAINTKL